VSQGGRNSRRVWRQKGGRGSRGGHTGHENKEKSGGREAGEVTKGMKLVGLGHRATPWTPRYSVTLLMFSL
jgi:hypothetical protein